MKPKPSRVDNLFSAANRRQLNPRQRILVADGAADIRLLNSEVLIYSGYHVDTVDNGIAAWNSMQINNYDLLIASQHLPGVSGVELLKKMHKNNLCLPVIMTTNVLPVWEFALHPWLQATTLLCLPYTFECLLTKVKNLLRLSANARREIAPPPNWERQSEVFGLPSALLAGHSA